MLHRDLSLMLRDIAWPYVINNKTMPKAKIATTQSTVSNNIAFNGIEIAGLIRQAKSAGADIIHFCEGALSGYTKEQLGKPENIDFNLIRKEIRKIQDLARELSIWVVVGSAHELSIDYRPHNSLYIISNNGDLVNRYDKRKCSHNELQNWYTPGFDTCYFEVNGIKFGCLICIEIQFPELFIQAEKDDVHCILFSSYSKDEIFGIQAQGYAASNNYWISMSIPTNTSQLMTSNFISPDGQVLSKCLKEVSSIIVTEINTEDERWHLPLKLAKPWRRQARKGDIYLEKQVFDERSELKTIC